jgi:Rps23 Pro-64 3,4-dihydroxylase Tpa1-like proline 4-hydroxylase
MTTKQILDAFSETLLQDERILSTRERELVTSLLQNARAAANGNPQTRAAVTAAMSQALGETVGQRAFAVLGGSMVEQILATAAPSTGVQDATPKGMSPQPPPGPQPPAGPGPHATPKPWAPQPPSGPKPTGPQPPAGPPGPHTSPKGVLEPARTVAVLDRPENLPAQCVVLDEFLAPQELDELIRYALEHESDFRASEVVSPNADEGVTDYDHRRSRVLMELGKHQDIVIERIQSVLPRIVQKLGMELFAVSRVEAQITASNDGDFFRGHSDNGDEKIASRELTFVYFFHREPRQFTGGELRIHDSRLENGQYVSTGSYQTIEPQQNQIVFFPCSLLHEITPVECPSRTFADSRFTLNGWLHR